MDKVILNRYRQKDKTEEYLSKISENLEIVSSEDGTPIGLAAINTTNGHFGLDNIGGFAAGGHSRSVTSMADSYIGSLRREPDGPRRGAGTLSPSQEIIAAWASDQAVKLSTQDIYPANKYIAAANVCTFGGDPLPIATALLNREFFPITAVADKLISGEAVFMPVDMRQETDRHLQMEAIMLAISNYQRSYLSHDEIELYGNVVEAWNTTPTKDKGFHLIALDENIPNSFVGCLNRACTQAGYSITFDLIENHVFGKYIGQSSDRDKIETGKEICQPALKLTATKNI